VLGEIERFGLERGRLGELLADDRAARPRRGRPLADAGTLASGLWGQHGGRTAQEMEIPLIALTAG
jgi:hypothetical protein